MPNLLAWDLIGRDISASKAFRDVGNEAERTGKMGERAGTGIASGLKVAGAALLGSGLVMGFKALYEAADESRKIGALTTQVIKSTGGAANVSAKQVSDLAGAIAKKTGVDDEAIQSGQNLLLTFTNVRNEVGKGNNIFDQATQTITDMSVALGQDTSSSAIQLGKALNDPIKGVTALQRVGVSFTASQKEQIATLVESGDVLGAQKIILAELGKEFGGAAEAASTPLQRLQQRAGDLAEEFGGKLIPYVDRAATFLMDDLLPAASRVGEAVGGVLGPALHVAGEALGFIYDVGKGAVDLFNDLPGPLQVTIGALGAMAALKGPIGSVFTTIVDFGETAYLRTLLLKDTIGSLGGAAGTAKGALGGLVGLFGGPWGLAVAAVAGSFALLNAATEDNEQVTVNAADVQRDFADALRESKGVIDENVRASAAKSLQDQGVLDIAEKAGISLSRVTDAILGNKDAYGEVSAALETYYNNRLIASGYEKTGETTAHDQAAAAAAAATNFDILAGTLGLTATQQEQLAAATGQASNSMGPAAAAADQLEANLQDTADAASEARSQTDLFKTSLDFLTGQNVSLIEVQAQLQDSLAAATEAMTTEGGAVLNASGALDLHTENGRKAADVLLDVRNSGNELIATMIQQGATTDEVAAKDAQLRQDFINTAGQMGINRQAAEALADQILGIPASRNTTITADTRPASDAIDGIVGKMNAQGLYTASNPNGRVALPNEYGNIVEAYANGGLRPMRGGLAAIVAPNTWRVIGDRVKDDEAYIPINNDPRSQDLLKETASRMGYQLVAANTAHLADGGILADEYIWPMGVTDAKLATLIPRGMADALAWARGQVGRPYLWGGVGPSGYDCSGFMSAITNVILGRSPHSRVGSTASFPWKGFAGGSGPFTIGSTKNAGGGVGHMAGTLLGVNVESRGGTGVVVGGSARGASNALFNTRAHLAMAGGGVIGEPVSGIGHYSGRSYSFGERGPETVTPGVPGGGDTVFHLYDSDGVLMGTMRGEAERVVTGALTTATNRGVYSR